MWQVKKDAVVATMCMAAMHRESYRNIKTLLFCFILTLLASSHYLYQINYLKGNKGRNNKLCTFLIKLEFLCITTFKIEITLRKFIQIFLYENH